MQPVGLTEHFYFIKAEGRVSQHCLAASLRTFRVNNVLFCLVDPALQPVWSPDLSDVGTELETPQRSSPDKCAFCKAVVPQEQMNSHLYLHFSPKSEADSGSRD